MQTKIGFQAKRFLDTWGQAARLCVISYKFRILYKTAWTKEKADKFSYRKPVSLSWHEQQGSNPRFDAPKSPALHSDIRFFPFCCCS